MTQEEINDLNKLIDSSEYPTYLRELIGKMIHDKSKTSD